jgi:antitoxin component YwqK of YwqJK toxin-antitoxin module
MKRIHVYLDDNELDDSLRLVHDGEPFTGELVNGYGDTLLSLETYRDGFRDGPTREWHEDGTLKAEGTNRHGVAVGTFRRWHPNGRLAVEKQFDDAGRLLGERRWDEDGGPEPFRRTGMPE